MKRLAVLLFLALSFSACGGAEPAEETTAATEVADETTASDTSTAGGYVDKVTRAQEKAREIAAEENERAEQVDEAMKDQ